MVVPAFRAAAAIFMALVAVIPVTAAPPSGGDTAPDGPAVAAGRVQPPPDPLASIEILSQNITIWLYPGNRSIAVEGSMQLRSYHVTSQLQLYLHQTLDLVTIVQEGQPLQYTRNIELLTIDLASELAINETLDLSFYYNGSMWYTENGLRQDCVGWEGAYLKGSTFWYLRHHASDWFDCRLKICCPPNWTAVADGELLAEEHSTRWSNYTWQNDLPCIRPALAAGNYSVAARAISGTNVSVYTYPEHSALASAYLDEAAAVMQFYEGILGPYGRKGFKIVETAHETMIGYACSGFVMLHPSAFSGGPVNYGLLAHETGHMWFPYATGYHGWAYPWLWEAFPEYLSCLYEMEHHGGRSRLDRDYNAYMAVYDKAGLPTIRGSNWDTPYSFETIYAKGAWVVRMLHGIVGDARFRSILDSYVRDNLWGYGSVQAFLSCCAELSPVDLDAFWDQWFNTTDALDVSLPEARQYDNGTAYRLELGPSNLLPATGIVDIKVEYTDGTSVVVERGWDGTPVPVVLDLPQRARQVFLDPEGWLLDVDRSNQAAVPLSSGELHQLRPEPPELPENLTEGNATEISARILNDGWYTARNVRVDFLVDGCFTATSQLNITQQGWALATAPWTPARGRREVTVAVDPDGGFHEWDEGDNNASVTVEVAPPPPRLDVAVGDLSVGETLAEGQRCSLNVTVRNAGDAALGLVGVEYLLDGSPLGRRDLTGLAVGGEGVASLEWTARRGHHNLTVRADPDGLIDETDELNNFAHASFFVSWFDTLLINHSPANPRTLEPVTFTVDGDAEEFRFSWDGDPAGPPAPERTTVRTFMTGGRHSVAVEGLAGGHVVGEGSLEFDVTNRPPEVSAYFDPASPLSLATVVFTARTLDLDGTVVSVSWDFGDGGNGTGGRAEHAYARPGTYTVRCTARDDLSGENTTTLRVTVGNRPPVIGWTGIPAARVGERLDFIADASDPDGTVTGCGWQFGDGASAEGQNVSHSYSRPGIYIVTVTVRDDRGEWANRTGRVEVRADGAAAQPAPDLAWVAAPVAVAAGAVAAAAILVWRRRRATRQRDDFFRPPPRRGHNP